MSAHDSMLDTVAVYALGALPADEAAALRLHLATCAECREEYRLLKPAVDAVAYSAQAGADPGTGGVAPSARLKERIMQQVRLDAIPRMRTANVGEMRAVRPIVWPAYAVAAACFALALVTSIFNISLNERVHQAQSQVAQMNAYNSTLSRNVAKSQTEVSDIVSADSQHFPIAQGNGEVIKHGSRLYIAMTALPAPPKGKVYQAWMLHAGATHMTPSVTFVPNGNGLVVIPVPVDASNVVAVAVSIEPEGGSKHPTSKPTFVLKLS